VRRFCGPHKEEGHVDVKSKRCEADGCDKIPTFGRLVGCVRRFCEPRKEEGHVNVRNKMREADGCDKQASCGSEAEDLLRFCKPHSRDGDVLFEGPRSWGTVGGGVTGSTGTGVSRNPGAERCCARWHGRGSNRGKAQATRLPRSATRQLIR
jgi:hypothetical protein